MLRLLASVSFLFLIIPFYAQNSQEVPFGKPNQQELIMEGYSKDPDAPAVVLYEKANVKVELINNYITFVIDAYKKIKVFDATNFKGKEEVIPYYDGEDLFKVEAITHNGSLQRFIPENQFYKKKIIGRYNEATFTYPDVRDGSVLEMRYELRTTNPYRVDGWVFQTNIPIVYTEYHADLPGNYRYNKVLVGNIPLVKNEAKLKKNCFYIDGYAQYADCESITYAMQNVPAFIEEEYMLSPKNFKAALKLELREYTSTTGVVNKLAEDWDDVDNEIRVNKHLGRQLKNNNFFEDKVPAGAGNLAHAKAIYYHMQQHLNCNTIEVGIYHENDCKEAYERGSGNATEINLALINALQAHNFKADLTLLSTRDNGLPTTQYPVQSDFNYLVCFLQVDGQEFLLDASGKNLPFGMIPYKALNTVARVIDYKNESFWINLTPQKRNLNFVRIDASITEENTLEGSVTENSTGYFALENRDNLSQNGKNKFVENKSAYNPDIVIKDVTLSQETALEKPLKEVYNFEVSIDQINDDYFIAPFLAQKYFRNSPFNLKERTYSVEFGYPRNINYAITINIDDAYEVVAVPKNSSMALPDGIGEYKIDYFTNDTSISASFNLQILKERVLPENYEVLKEFFNKISSSITSEVFQLKKI